MRKLTFLTPFLILPLLFESCSDNNSKENGSLKLSMTDAPLDADAVRFPNAITSDMVNEEGIYKLSYLTPGIYDLIVTETINGEFNQELGAIEDVEVESLNESISDFNIDEL